jgi:hypothetical protein
VVAASLPPSFPYIGIGILHYKQTKLGKHLQASECDAAKGQ